MTRLVASIFAFTALGVSFLGACGSTRDDFTDEQPPPFAVDGGEAGRDPQCGFRCSRDLKKVLKGCDDDVEVVAECPAGQGCGVDSCVDACASAALSKGSLGCSFWTLPPDDSDYGAGSCFAAMVANTFDVPVDITAEYGSDSLDISKSIYTVERPDPNAEPKYTQVTGALLPGQVAVVFLAAAEHPLNKSATACPDSVVPALKIDPLRHGTAKTKAFHLATNAPIAAYSIFPYGGASSQFPTATLLLPVTAWDTSYIAVAPAVFGKVSQVNLSRRTLQIVANEDNTEISMRPTADISQGDQVAPGVTGEIVKWALSKGQVLQITQPTPISGSPVVANKPVGVFGGSPCTFLPADVEYCDLTQQQIAPFSQWGTSYALVPYLSRIAAVEGTIREIVPWTFVGAADGTVLTYDPVKPPGAPDTLSAGQIVTFQTDAVATVKSQDSKHPFHVSVYMTGSMGGGGTPGAGKVLGDPDFVSMAPSDQFLDHYIFFTDYTFPETSLTLVRRKTAGSFKPVTLECAGEITGWQPLGASGEYEYTWMRLTAGAVPQKFGSGTCGYGRHEASSDGPFSVTVWGIGKDASYGFAGGMGSRPVNDAPPPTIH
ncbi:IgGFc-binding protein [Labilithrix luteola]|uniref:IgGFc-binding protein n=1 Tax=Labilithrix luteola TaxID=1391654 RepID=UPI0011BAA857|nr:IgGFc-binding protein [Labilithrix luteola]